MKKKNRPVPKQKPARMTAAVFAELVKQARELGVVEIEVDGFRAKLGPPAPVVMKIPESTLIPEMDDFAKKAAMANLERLGFRPKSPKRETKTFSEELDEFQKAENEVIDRGLFIDRSDFSNLTGKVEDD